MHLEISIEARNHVKKDLLQRLAHLVPQHHVEETAPRHGSDRFAQSFIFETSPTDVLLPGLCHR